MASELRVVKVGADAKYPRTIQPYCSDSRAPNFGQVLQSFEQSCESCAYLNLRQSWAGAEQAAG